MSQPKFTPGPWRLVLLKDDDTCVYPNDKGTGPICTIGLQNDANAHLIAAALARELYKAQARHTMNSYLTVDNHTMFDEIINHFIDPALKKARGE